MSSRYRPCHHAAIAVTLCSLAPAFGQTVHEVGVGPGFAFIPAQITIDVGETVRWVWVGGLHNVESGVSGVHDGNFRSGDPTATVGTVFELTFDQAFLDAHPLPQNVYPYYCIVHVGLGMIGSVTVIEPGDADRDGDIDLQDYAQFFACVSGPDAPFDTDGLQTHNVTLSGFDFSPANLSIEFGDTVHWQWVSGLHNVESGVGGVHDGNFRSGDPTSTSGTVFDVTFDEAFLDAHPVPGNAYPYYCAVHVSLGMAGTVTAQPDECATFDFDGDGDVDLLDFGAFQLAFSGG